LCLVTLSCLAQTENTKTDSTEKTSLIVAAVYSTNANYYGQTSAEKLPYVLTNATVKFPGGLWLSAAAYKLLNIGSGISAANAGAGIDFNLNKSKSLIGSLSYTRSFFPENSPLLQAANENTASASLTYDWNYLNSGLSADYAFGSENDWFVSFSNSKLFSLGSLFSNKDYVSIEPALEIVAGTQHFYETYTENKKVRDKLLGKITDPLFPSKGQGQNQTTTTTVSSSSFDLLSYNLKLPLAYNRSNYVIEGSCQLSMLSDKVQISSGKLRSFFNMSFYYLF
jgi:hypothetical protein